MKKIPTLLATGALAAAFLVAQPYSASAEGMCAIDVSGITVHASSDEDATVTTTITPNDEFNCENDSYTFKVDGVLTPVDTDGYTITLPTLAPGRHYVQHNGFGVGAGIIIYAASRVSLTASDRKGSKFTVSGTVEHYAPGGFVPSSGAIDVSSLSGTSAGHASRAVSDDGSFSADFNTNSATTVTATMHRQGYIDAATSDTVTVHAFKPVTVKKPVAKVTHFKTCTAVHKKYSGGIAKTHTTKNTIHHRNGTVTRTRLKGTVKHSTTWYNANKRLDRDHDGVACEKS